MCMYCQPTSAEARAAEREAQRIAREENRRARERAEAARLCAQNEALSLTDEFKQWAADLFDRIAYLAVFGTGKGREYKAFCECGKTFIPDCRKSGAYVVCPHCGKRARLRDVRRSSWWGADRVVALLQRCSVGYMQRIFVVYKQVKFFESCQTEIRVSFAEEQRDVVGAGGFAADRYFSFHAKRTTGEYIAGRGYQHGSGWNSWVAESQMMDTYPGNLASVLFGGKFQYSQLAAAAAHNKVNPFDYLRAYEKEPQQLEMLYKTGLYKFAKEYTEKEVRNGQDRWANFSRLSDYGLTTKEAIAEAALHDYGIAEVLACKRIRGWELEGNADRARAVEFMLALNEFHSIEFEYEFITNKALYRYWERQESTGAWQASRGQRRVWNFLADYRDYVRCCKELNYDLRDTAISRPQNFTAAHDRVMSIEKQLRRAEREKAISAVHTVYERLHGLIEWTDGKLQVRMAHDAEDLVREGREMCHCVGGYCERVGEGRCIIFFVRRAAEPDKVFYTVEIKPNLQHLEVVQCRGYKNKDRSPEDKAEVDAFMEKYARWFNHRPLGEIAPPEGQPEAACVAV